MPCRSLTLPPPACGCLPVGAPPPLCLQVMNEVLRDWVLLRAKVPVGEAVPGLPAGLEVQEFYVLR